MELFNINDWIYINFNNINVHHHYPIEDFGIKYLHKTITTIEGYNRIDIGALGRNDAGVSQFADVSI